MSIPIECKKCGTIVGEIDSFWAMCPDMWQSYSVPDKNPCSHPKPEITETRKLFGLINHAHTYYPETQTSSSWKEYIGPNSKFWLWFAIVFGSKQYPNGGYEGVTVNGEWVWWEWKLGFYGDGIAELGKTKVAAL